MKENSVKKKVLDQDLGFQSFQSKNNCAWYINV